MSDNPYKASGIDDSSEDERDRKESILSRPAKMPPIKSLTFSIVCFSLASVVPDSTFCGGLLGGGVGLLIVSAWDFGRLKFLRWRQARADRHNAPR